MSPATRKIELVRGAWGATLLIAPRATLTAVHRLRVDRTSLTVTRILGVRHLVQAASSGITPSPEVLAMGVWVDIVHALTALGLAATDRSRVRAGLTDALAAAVWAAVGYHDLEHAAATAPAHDRRRDQLARGVLAFAPAGGPLLAAASRARSRTTSVSA